jgi:hypothetical protein
MTEFTSLSTVARWILLRSFEQPESTMRSLMSESAHASVVQVAHGTDELVNRGLATRVGEHVRLTAVGASVAARYVD